MHKTVYIYNEGVKEFKPKEINSFLKDNFAGIELRIIKQKEPIVYTDGIVLNLPKTIKLFGNFVKEESAADIILTNKLFVTPDDDKRLHIRMAVFSQPCIISSAGIVEGPAKPREFYLLKQRYDALGLWSIKEQEAKDKFKGKFIDYGDSRINEVIKGLIAQAIFFYAAGNPFCEKKNCRLFNAHWQEDLIYSQVKKAEFCFRHKKMLSKMNNL